MSSLSPTIDTPIHMFDPRRHFQQHREVYDKHLQRVFDSGKFIMGPEVKELEEKCSQYVNSKFAIGVASGTDALQIALMALDIQPGDEVLTVPFTWISTVEVIKLLHATPTFCDINDMFLMDPSDLQKKINEKTKAIIPVSMFGQPVDMDSIIHVVREAEQRYGHRIYIIEDAAQSFGAITQSRKFSCSLGDISCTSFFPSKPLGCFGDGGMCFTDDDTLAKKIGMIRNHGCAKRYQYECVGVNSRLDTLQAAILLSKFNFLEDFHTQRNQKATRYTTAFASITGIIPPVIGNHTFRHVWAQYTIQLADEKTRDELLAHLKKDNIFAATFYPVQLHLVPCITQEYAPGDMPVAERLGKNVLSLPVYPELTEQEQEYVITSVLNFFSNRQ